MAEEHRVSADFQVFGKLRNILRPRCENTQGWGGYEEGVREELGVGREEGAVVQGSA